MEQLLYPLTVMANERNAHLTIISDDRHDIEQFKRWLDKHKSRDQDGLITTFYPKRISGIVKAKGDLRSLSAIADWIVGDIRLFFKRWGSSVIYPMLTGDAAPPHGPQQELQFNITDGEPFRFVEIGPFKTPLIDEDPRKAGDHSMVPGYSSKFFARRISYGMNDGNLRTLCFLDEGQWKISTMSLDGLPPQAKMRLLEMLR